MEIALGAGLGKGLEGFAGLRSCCGKLEWARWYYTTPEKARLSMASCARRIRTPCA